MLSDFERVQSETWCSLPFGEIEQRLLPLPPLFGGDQNPGTGGSARAVDTALVS